MLYGILSWILMFSHTTTGAEGPTNLLGTYDGPNVVDAIHARAYAQVDAASPRLALAAMAVAKVLEE